MCRKLQGYNRTGQGLTLQLEVCGHRWRWYSLMSGCYTPEPNPRLNRRPQLKCTDIMREAKRESTEIAAPRLKKEPSVALYSRPLRRQQCCNTFSSQDWPGQKPRYG